MIPDIPEIKKSLLALSLVEVSQAIPDDRCVIVCERIRRTQRSESGEQFFQDMSPLVLQQSLGAPLTIPRLLDRIAAEMYGAGHSHVSPKTDQRQSMAAKVLGMATALGGSKLALLETLNQIIFAISPARVSQWAVLINPGTSQEHYRFGDFIYGNVEVEKLQYRSEKAGSNFARLYAESLHSRRSILREGRELKIIDVNAIQATTVPDAMSRIMYRIYDCYCGDVASIERELFMTDLDRQQAIFGAAGLGTIPSETLRTMDAMTQWITIFERQERGHGWVVPEQTVIHLSSTEPKALADGYVAIKNALKLGDWDQRPLDASIQTYSQYLTAAQDHERNDRIEEGLLHIVFALDLLLGGRSAEALTAVLAERTAIVSYLAVGMPLEEIRAFVKDCYDMRSAYVHRGEKGRRAGLNARFARLLEIARAVLGAACFARLQPWCQHDDVRDAWVKRIDVLRARHTAGLALAPAELAELGLTQIRVRTGELVSVLIEKA